MSTDVARSRSAETPSPADCSVTSSWRFFMSSTDSPNGRYSTFAKSLYVMPAAARIVRALSSVPDFGAPTEMRLALEVGERLDAGVGARDDLDVVRIDGRDAAQLFQRRLEARFLVALPRIRQRIAERERHLAAPGLQQVEVLHRRLGRLHGCLDAGDRLADVIGECHAERVVDAAGAARQDVDELVGGGSGRAHRGEKREGKEITKKSDHEASR